MAHSRFSIFDFRFLIFNCSLLSPLILLVLPTHAIDGPLSPEDSLTYLKTEPGLKVELVASEPMVVSPVAVAWDEKGRMYVVEDRGYPIGPGNGKPPGTVVNVVQTGYVIGERLLRPAMVTVAMDAPPSGNGFDTTA